MPTKHVPLEQTLLGLGGQLLTLLRRGDTVTALWERARELPHVGSFARFVHALDLLYAIGALEFRDFRPSSPELIKT